MNSRLSRGKRLDIDKWVIGYYVHLQDHKGNESHRIYLGYADTDCGDFYPGWFEVDPETVGGDTGLTDENGKQVFEGDIVLDCGIPCKIAFENCQYKEIYAGDYWADIYDDSIVEVIGNIHDNPELMEIK